MDNIVNLLHLVFNTELQCVSGSIRPFGVRCSTKNRTEPKAVFV